MFAKRRPKNLRKKRALDSESDEEKGKDEDKSEGEGAGAGAGVESEDSSSVVRPAAKVAKTNPLVATSAREKKVESLAFESERTVAPSAGMDGGATRSVEVDTAYDRDAIAVERRAAALAKEGKIGEGTYKGQTAYVAQSKNRYGPQRAAGNVRAISLMDYQPDVCKDYKETGYCGFGDSCKFLHDRGDYKSGWELDREWDEKQKAAKDARLVGDDSDSDESDDEFPFACFICRTPFVDVANPVVTRCEHYFCEHCALDHNAKTQKCFVCGQATHGIFNKATRLLQRIAEKEKGRKEEE